MINIGSKRVIKIYGPTFFGGQYNMNNGFATHEGLLSSCKQEIMNELRGDNNEV